VPLQTEVFSLGGAGLVNVSRRFPSHAGSDLPHLMEMNGRGRGPDPALWYLIGRRYDIDGNSNKANDWYRKSAAEYRQKAWASDRTDEWSMTQLRLIEARIADLHRGR
jgi:hypothetical protein